MGIASLKTTNRPFFQVEVVFADQHQQKILKVSIPPTSSITAAINLSGILLDFPNIDLSKNKVGIFGKLCNLDAQVRDGDRIEIYQPLLIDPKKIRINRAKQQKTA
jgi:putative ubiquitin-RnfH superfamily antitoxin RatB of RatAB toxin-antitoxin module